jgi:hypothetical protein
MADIMPQGGPPADDDDILIDTTEGASAADPALPVLNEDGSDAEAKLPKGAVRQADGSIILTLQHPCAITYRRKSDGAQREEELKQLHLHRLTGADMRAVSAASTEKNLVVALARSTRIMEGKMALFFDRMDGEDAVAALECVSSFLGNGPKTGR